KDGEEVCVEDPARTFPCKVCGVRIVWGFTRAGQWLPLVKDSAGGWASHLAACPGARKARRAGFLVASNNSE
ncbi:MAG: hypothetical protein WC478_05615, partial [Candidatus Omnitrophota bacterium]